MAQVMMDHNGSGCFGTRLAPKAEARFRAEQPYKSHHSICKGLSFRVNVLIPSGMGTPVKRYMS